MFTERWYDSYFKNNMSLKNKESFLLNLHNIIGLFILKLNILFLYVLPNRTTVLTIFW